MATLLYQDWSKWSAFACGVIDANGDQVKEPATIAESSTWTYFHKLAAKLKHLIETIPGGKSKVGKLVVAYSLFAEDTNDQKLFETFDTTPWIDTISFITEEFVMPTFSEYVRT